GFTAEPGSTLVIPQHKGPTLVAVGVGTADQLDTGRIRDAAAAFARAVPSQTELAFTLEGLDSVPTEAAAQAVVEGMLLARYEYSGKRERKSEPIESITVVANTAAQAAVQAGPGTGAGVCEGDDYGARSRQHAAQSSRCDEARRPGARARQRAGARGRDIRQGGASAASLRGAAERQCRQHRASVHDQNRVPPAARVGRPAGPPRAGRLVR